jgi:uncharacterized membrane protein YphA (DoxX/SURF4 family)
LLADSDHDPSTTALVRLGRLFTGVSLLAIGIQHFLYSGFIPDLGLVPHWAPAHTLCAWIAGAILLIAGISILTAKFARPISTFLGFVFLLSAFLRFTAHIPGMIHNIGDRGVFFELLACCAGSWMLASTFPPSSRLPLISDARTARLATPRLATLARWLFGIAFVAAGLSIAAHIWMRLSATLLGLMLFSWVVIVHAPRIAHALHNADEWNSGYVCLMMAGFALIAASLAASSSPENS